MGFGRITSARGRRKFVCRYDDAIGRIEPNWAKDADRETIIADIISLTDTVTRADQLASVADKDLRDFASGVMTREAVLKQLRTGNPSGLPLLPDCKPYVWEYTPLSGPQYAEYYEIFDEQLVGSADTLTERYRRSVDLLCLVLYNVENWDAEDGEAPAKDGKTNRDAIENSIPVDWVLELADTIYESATLSATQKKAYG